VALVVVGIANSVLDVTGITLLQRLTPNESRVAVFGLFDSVANGGVALGGILAPVLVDAVGIRAALLVAAAVLPLTAIVSWPLLRRVDEGGPGGARQGELIRGDPLFAPLSLATVEHLAATLRPVRFDDSSYLMRQGEPGDEYVLVDTGTIDVEVDGVLVDRLGAGAGVGEIALLRAVPRTASVRAVGPVDAFSLDRASFLEAVTGHRIAAAVADDRVRERLARR
jgi:MFS family permease